MRTIKFRGREFASDTWVYGGCNPTPKGFWITIPKNEVTFDNYRVVPETVGQFTGAFDCEGREIYEGDILSACYGHSPNITEVTGVVEFVHCGFALRFGKDAGVWLDQLIHAEIIGNIHNNPDLLKGGAL